MTRFFVGDCFWGFVFAVVVFAVVFAVVVFAVVVVETWHAASLPDGTGTEQGRNRNGTETGTGTGAGCGVVRWLKRFANPNVGNARRMNNGFFDN